MTYSIYKVSIEDYCSKFFANMNKELLTTVTNWNELVNKVNAGTESFKNEGYVLMGACFNRNTLEEEKCHPSPVSGNSLHNELSNNYWKNKKS